MGRRTVAWFVEVADDPMLVVVEEDDREDYIREILDKDESPNIMKYLVWSASPGMAISKAMRQFIIDFRDGHDLRLGQGQLYAVIERTHTKEADKWQGKTLR